MRLSDYSFLQLTCDTSTLKVEIFGDFEEEEEDDYVQRSGGERDLEEESKIVPLTHIVFTILALCPNF